MAVKGKFYGLWAEDKDIIRANKLSKTSETSLPALRACLSSAPPPVSADPVLVQYSKK